MVLVFFFLTGPIVVVVVADEVVDVVGVVEIDVAVFSSPVDEFESNFWFWFWLEQGFFFSLFLVGAVVLKGEVSEKYLKKSISDLKFTWLFLLCMFGCKPIVIASNAYILYHSVPSSSFQHSSSKPFTIFLDFSFLIHLLFGLLARPSFTQIGLDFTAVLKLEKDD